MQRELWISFSKLKTNFSIFFQTLSSVLLVFIVVLMLVTSAAAYKILDENKALNMLSYSISYLIEKLPFDGSKIKMSSFKEDGEIIKYTASNYKTEPRIINAIKNESSQILLVLLSVFFVSILFTWLILKFILKLGGTGSTGKFIRGAKIITESQMKKLIRMRKETSDYLIGAISIPTSKLSRHIGFFGDTGVGKSVSIMELLDVIRSKKESAFIIDKSGEFIQHFYDPEIDIILSPFDDRSKCWSPFYEADDIQDYERLARSFIPTVESSGQNDHWPEASVTVLSWLMYELSIQIDRPSIDDIIDILTIQDKVVEENLLGDEEIIKTRKLNELLRGTLAELLIDPESPEHTNSVIASITPKIRALFYLRGLENREPYSIRDWVNDDDRKGWIFIRVSEDQLDAVNPVITAWIDTFIKCVISLPKSRSRIIHAVIDELQSFEKINTLSKAASEGRKHGLRLMLGFTSIMELISKYGEHSVKSTLSMLNTKVIFTTSEPDAAEWCAKILGEEDVKLPNESISAGTNDNVSMSDDRRKQFVVLPSEIQLLPDLTSYVKFSGDWPVTSIKTMWKDRPVIAEHFIKRTLPVPNKRDSGPSINHQKETFKTDLFEEIDLSGVEEQPII